MTVQPAQRPTPEEPFVEIASQDKRRDVDIAHMLEKFFDLQAPVTGAQAKMRGDDAQRLALARKHHVERAARFAPGHTEVKTLDGGDVVPRQGAVAEIAMV